MPRGRPKKVQTDDFLVKTVTKTKKVDVIKKTTPNSKDAPVTDVKVVKNAVKCDLCGGTIQCSPTHVNLTYLTGKADWHRNCADKFTVCSKCAKELSDTIDNFIIKKNKKMKRWSVDG